MFLKPGRLLLFVAMGLLTACQDRQHADGGHWDRFMAGFIDTYFEANPTFAVYQGRHEYDGRLPDWTEAGLKSWNARLHQLRDSAATFTMGASDSAKQLERDYLIAVIDR